MNEDDPEIKFGPDWRTLDSPGPKHGIPDFLRVENQPWRKPNARPLPKKR